MTFRLGICLLASGCYVGGGESGWEFQGSDTLVMKVGSGEIEVGSTPSDTLRVWWDGGGLGDNGSPSISERGGVVTVDANGGIFGGGDLYAEVPAGVTLELTVERGSIEVVLDEPSSVFACTAAGSVYLEVPPGPYELRLAAGVGAVGSEIWHEPGSPYWLDACVGAGDVQIRGR